MANWAKGAKHSHRFFFGFLVLVVCMISFHARNASAAEWYTETGGGISDMIGGGTFFGPTIGALGLGMAGTFTLGVDLSQPRNLIHFGLGLETKFLSASGVGGSASMLVPYPMIRLAMRRIFLTLGASPIIHAKGTLLTAMCGLAEAGYLFPIDPEIDFGLSAGIQAVDYQSVIAPSAALDASVFFRFYIGKRSKNSGAGMDAYRGWRYPYGVELH